MQLPAIASGAPNGAKDVTYPCQDCRKGGVVWQVAVWSKVIMQHGPTSTAFVDPMLILYC